MSYLPVRPGTAVDLFMHGQTSGFQNSGMGAYDRVGDWSWEFFGPNAFAFLDPADSTPQPAPMLPNKKWFGMGGCGCGGSCGGCGSHKHGVGQTALPAVPAPGGGVFGTGLFASTDISSWGWGEWVVIAAGGYLGISLLNDISSAGSATAKTYRRMTR